MGRGMRQTVKQLKFELQDKFSGEWGKEPEGAIQKDEIDVPCVRVADFDRARKQVDDDVPTIRRIPRSVFSKKRLKPGDILVEKSGGGEKTPVGDAMLYEGSDHAICANFIEVVRPLPGNDSRYWKYLLGSGYANGDTRTIIKQTTGIQNLDLQRYFDRKMYLPSLEEQQLIADYLDAETAEIDATVAKLDELLEDLDHRRTKTLEFATSGQMSPDSTSQDFKQLKFEISRRFAGDWGDDEGKLFGDLPCVRVADFDRPTNSVTDDVPTIRSYKKQTIAEKHLEDGDILVEKSGGGEKTPVGAAMLYHGGNKALCANFIEVVRPNQNHDSRYWTYLLSAGYDSGETRTIIKQTTGIQNLDMQRYFDRVKFLPPLDEQRRIADYLDVETARIDKMKATATELRDELLARRKALITEVVTGRKRLTGNEKQEV